MFIVETVSESYTWYLKGTTWTSARETATRFDDAAAAKAGLDRARPYTKPKLWKKAVTVPA